MTKGIKRACVLIAVICIILGSVYYFLETHHAMGLWMHFSPQAAIGEDSDTMLFEYRDEDFYVGFNKEGKTTSAKKNVALWVKYDFDFFDGWQDFPSVQVATVNEKVYLYGSICSETVEEVKLFRSDYEIKNTKFFGERVQYEKTYLCFCLVIPVDEIKFLSYSILFVDKENRVVPLVEDNNLYREALSDQIYNTENHLQTISENEFSIGDSHSDDVVLNKQLYLYNGVDRYGCGLREVTDVAKFWIPVSKEFMYIKHNKTVDSIGFEQVHGEKYESFYKVKYTDDLKKVFE